MAFVIVRELIKKQLITTDKQNELTDKVVKLIEEDIKREEELDEEVKELLLQYSDAMRKENVDYGEMFRMIKNRLAKEKGIIL
jgi:hypothetical protein